MNIFRRQIRKLNGKQKFVLFLAGVFVVLLFIFGVVLGTFRNFFWDTPFLAGFPLPKKYLVLLQNNNELRPGGGFLSGYGVIKMTWGVPSVRFSDSYTISTSDYVTPPYPFVEFIGDDPFYTGWQFRDANYSPDFETSVKQILAFYNMQYPNDRFHAVVAMDFEVIENLLRVLGGVTADSNVFTAENFFINIQRASKDIDLHNEEELAERKSILASFASALMKKIIFSPLRYGAVLGVLEESLNEKHMLLYSSSEGLQSKFAKRGWDGKMHFVSGEDFLHVNVANIGGRKADRYVQKRFEYTVSFPLEGQARVRLIETFTHQGDYNLQSDRYQAYVRTYVPLGSRLVRSDTDSVDSVFVGEELRAQYYGNMLKMMPGERRVFVYEYDLPVNILPENYVLRLAKQAGVIGDDYLVTIRMPNDHPVLDEGSDVTLWKRENVATWQGALSRDIVLRVQKGADVSSPLIQWQQFRNAKTIEIRFNEDIDPESISVLSNFSVVDKNFANSMKDDISVANAWMDGKDLLLSLKGLNYISGERYAVTLKNIKDLSGNYLEPNPREITVVQR